MAAAFGDGVGISKRVQETTIANWTKKLGIELTQKLVFLSLLQKKGQIKHVDGGGELRWGFQARDVSLGDYVDGKAKVFQRSDLDEVVKLPWRGYEANEVITKQERLEHGGKQTMIEVFAGREKRIREGLMRQLGKECYLDGNATGRSRKWHGLESFMSISTQTATDELQTTSNDTYAGSSTARGTYGGSSAADFSYNAFTPVIVNCNRTVGSTRDWADYADVYMRAGINEADYGSPSDQIDTIVLNKSAWRAVVDLLDDKERIVAERGEKSGLVALGFKTLNFDGVDVVFDFGVPTTDSNSDTVYGYGLNTDKVCLKILTDQAKGKSLFDQDVQWNQDYQATHLYWSMISNLVFESPRHFVKFAAIS